ncbi:MAG: tRNA pseudouridine(38-40) synthase TruA, partial [Ignavibacteria bacterium]|nr:tRNA pseudouridine(38-40) synthase TruA [Ignavibacteria bacterium]
GTRYSGWQIQKNSRTIQGALIGAIKKVFKTDEFDFQGSGRTDAGVHALLQVAHLEIKTVLAPEIIRMKLNDELPSDINIIEVEKAKKNFHARHDAISRSYIYQISKRRTAFGKKYVWWVKDKLNINVMRESIPLFTGMKDFHSFTDDDPDEKSTKVLIESIEIFEAGEMIIIRIVGSHFIWKLVRRIVGVMVEIGRGKLSISNAKKFFDEYSDLPAKLTAPPSGLFLEKVIYKGENKTKMLNTTFPFFNYDTFNC